MSLSERVMLRLSFLALGVMVMAATALAGCQRQSSHSGPADGSPVVIRFSDPGNAGIFAYAKREHILERELAKVHATIEWVPGGGSFSASFDAMNSGAINTSGGAISPIVGALSHRLPFATTGLRTPAGRSGRGSSPPHRARSGRCEIWSESAWP